MESSVRSSMIDPCHDLPSMSSTGPFDSLKLINLDCWKGTATTNTAQLPRLLALPSLEKLTAGLLRLTFSAKEIDEIKDERSDMSQNIVRVEDSNIPKLPLKSLLPSYSCIWERDLSATLDRTQSDKLETCIYKNIPYNWPGFSAVKHVVSLLNHAKHSLNTLGLHMQSPTRDEEPYRSPGDVFSDDDVQNNRDWAVGRDGLREFQVLNSLDVSAEIILGRYGRWYKTPKRNFQMLANEPESDEWKLVDLLPKSLKSLTIRTNRA